MSDYSELCEEIERLKSFKVAYSEWMDKTQWVQDSVHWSELGKHRADVILERMKRLAAENESLRKALREVMTQVDGNIRETVRDCVNGHNDVQDIYGYCDNIEALIDAAISSPENP